MDSAQETHPGASLGLGLRGGVPIVYRNSTVTSESSASSFDKDEDKYKDNQFLLLGSQSDIGYSSMVEGGQPLKGQSSSQRDLLTHVKSKSIRSLFNDNE